MYNLTNITNANNVYDVAFATSELSNFMYGYFVLLVVFLTAFAFMKNFDTKVVFLTSSFITTFIATMMFFIGLINFYGIIVPFILLLGSIIYNVWGNG